MTHQLHFCHGVLFRFGQCPVAGVGQALRLRTGAPRVHRPQAGIVGEQPPEVTNRSHPGASPANPVPGAPGAPEHVAPFPDCGRLDVRCPPQLSGAHRIHLDPGLRRAGLHVLVALRDAARKLGHRNTENRIVRDVMTFLESELGLPVADTVPWRSAGFIPVNGAAPYRLAAPNPVMFDSIPQRESVGGVLSRDAAGSDSLLIGDARLKRAPCRLSSSRPCPLSCAPCAPGPPPPGRRRHFTRPNHLKFDSTTVHGAVSVLVRSSMSSTASS